MCEDDLKKYACANCPIRRKAMANPRSVYARVHRWHSGWCPGWKNYQEAKRLLLQQERAAG